MAAALDPVADAKKGKLAPVYALAGSERFLVERALGALRDAAVPEALRALGVDVLDGATITPATFAQAARTLPMALAGVRRRCVIVRDADALVGGDKDPAPLLAYLADPAPSSVLILVAEKADQRSKLFADLKKRGFLVKLEAPPAARLPAWILGEAKVAEVALAERGAQRLAEVVGGDLGRLSQAITQLGLYCDGREVSSADVDELIAETRERSIFELTEAVARGDVAKTLVAVRRLLAQRESAIGAVALLARHVRQLWRAREIGRLSTGEAAAALGVPPFVVEGLRAQAQRFSPPALARGIVLLAEADRALKGAPRGALGEEAILERLCVRLAELGEGSASARSHARK